MPNLLTASGRVTSRGSVRAAPLHPSTHPSNQSIMPTASIYTHHPPRNLPPKIHVAPPPCCCCCSKAPLSLLVVVAWYECVRVYKRRDRETKNQPRQPPPPPLDCCFAFAFGSCVAFALHFVLKLLSCCCHCLPPPPINPNSTPKHRSRGGESPTLAPYIRACACLMPMREAAKPRSCLNPLDHAAGARQLHGEARADCVC